MTKKRARLLVIPEFQIRLISTMLVMALLVIALFYAANHYFFERYVSLGENIGLTGDHVYFKFLSEQRTYMNRIFGISALVVSLVLGLGGLILSHRVAGPIHRIRSHFRGISEGAELSPIRLRKGDFFPEVAEAFNQQVESLRGKGQMGTDK